MKVVRRGMAVVAAATTAVLVSATPVLAAPTPRRQPPTTPAPPPRPVPRPPSTVRPPVTTATSAPRPAPSTTSTTTSQNKDRIAALQARGRAEVEKRRSTISVLTQKLAANRHVGDADRAELGRQIQSVADGLSAAGARISGGTDVSAMELDVRTVMGETVVYRVLVPKVETVLKADAVAVEAERSATSLAPSVRALDALRARGRSTVQGDGYVAGIESAIASATAHAATATATALAASLDDSRSETWFGSASAELAAASADLRQASTLLRSLQRIAR